MPRILKSNPLIHLLPFPNQKRIVYQSVFFVEQPSVFKLTERSHANFAPAWQYPFPTFFCPGDNSTGTALVANFLCLSDSVILSFISFFVPSFLSVVSLWFLLSLGVLFCPSGQGGAVAGPCSNSLLNPGSDFFILLLDFFLGVSSSALSEASFAVFLH